MKLIFATGINKIVFARKCSAKSLLLTFINKMVIPRLIFDKLNILSLNIPSFNNVLFALVHRTPLSQTKVTRAS